MSGREVRPPLGVTAIGPSAGVHPDTSHSPGLHRRGLERALAHVRGDKHRHRALASLLAWPRLDLAAKLVIDHREIWAGQRCGALVPAAAAPEPDHPVAATILYRARLDAILARARSSAYGHGARYMARLAALAPGGFGALGVTDHDAYHAHWQKAHGRKPALWRFIDRAR